MRKIKYNDWVNGAWQTDFPNEALLHNFFTDPDNESRALIELPNGQVTDVRSDRVKFVEPPIDHSNGLTKREQFAMAAMQGMLANHTMIDTVNWEWIAENAVEQADMLLLKLEETK